MKRSKDLLTKVKQKKKANKKIGKSYSKQNVALLMVLTVALAGLFLYPYMRKIEHDQEAASENFFYSNFRYTENFDNGLLDENAWKVQKPNQRSVLVNESKLVINMTKLNENIKMTYTKEMEANFKISFDVDTRNFNNGKVVLDLFGSLAGEKSGFSLEFVPSEQGVVLKAGFVNDVTVKKIGEMTVAKEKEFNIKIARMGSNIYFGVDQQALGVMGSIYEGKVTPEFEFSNSNRGSSEIYLDSFYLEDVF